MEIEDNIRIVLSSSKKNGIKFIFDTESSIIPVFESKIYQIDESQYAICFVFFEWAEIIKFGDDNFTNDRYICIWGLMRF